MAKEKGIVISLIIFKDFESEFDGLKNIVELSGGEIINQNKIIDGFKDLLENQAISSDVKIKMNLNIYLLKPKYMFLEISLIETTL